MRNWLTLIFVLMLTVAFGAQAQTSYIDRFTGSVVASIGKQPVVAATTGPIALSGSQSIDGVTVSDHSNDSTGKAPDRVLVKNQADQTTNGIYVVVNSGPWVLAQDFSGPSGVVSGQLIIVNGGNSQAGLWQLTTADPVQVGSSGGSPSNITFSTYELPFASIGLTNGDIFVGNASNMAAEVAMSGDCTIANTGAITCPYSNGSPIVTSASTNTLTNKTYDTAGTGNVFKINGQQISAVSGNTSKVATASGTLTNTHCVSIDASGNFVDAGGACTTGGGGGTVSSGAQYGLAYYATAGTVVGASSTVTTDANGVLNVVGATITTNDPVLDLTQTWNASGVTFNGIFENITNTASAAASLLENLQVGGSTLWGVDKTGAVTTGIWKGTKVGLAYGGTNADLSATGGTHNFLKQSSSAAAITVGQPACADLSDSAASCATDATDASNLASGTVPTARLGSGTANSTTVLYGDQTYKTAATGSLVLLETINASAAAQVVFTSTYITSTYNKYVVEFDSVYGGSSAVGLCLQVSTNNGSSWIILNYTGLEGGCSSGASQQGISIGGTISGTSTSVTQGTLKFSNPSASAVTVFHFDAENAGSNTLYVGAASNSTTAAINAIRIIPTIGSNNIGSGTINGNFHLYGIAGN